MQLFQAILLLSAYIVVTSSSPNPSPNAFKDLAITAASGRTGAGERTAQRFETVLKAARHHGLAPGKYAFYAIWDKEDQRTGSEDLTRLTQAIGGSHYALIVGTLQPHSFRGREVDARFVNQKQEKPNNNGEELRVANELFRENDKVRYAYVGEVQHADDKTIKRKGTIWNPQARGPGIFYTNFSLRSAKEVFVKAYDVKSNNCKTFVDKLHASLQRSDDRADSELVVVQRPEAESGGQPISRPGTCICQ